MADTGLAYHVDIEVEAEGKRPPPDKIAVARRNLLGVEARDRVKFGKIEQKWVYAHGKWWYVIGANVRGVAKKTNHGR